MMFAGTSGVDSQMDMIHPMVTDYFGRSVRFFSRDRRIMTIDRSGARVLPTHFAFARRSVVFLSPPICDFVES